MSITLCADLEVTVLYYKGEKAMELSNVRIELNVKGIYCVSNIFLPREAASQKTYWGLLKYGNRISLRTPKKKPTYVKYLSFQTSHRRFVYIR